MPSFLQDLIVLCDGGSVALKNAGVRLPPLHITVNLSPADIRKEGSAYDLPLAIGILASAGEIQEDKLSKYHL